MLRKAHSTIRSGRWQKPETRMGWLLRVFGYGSIIGRWMQRGKVRRVGQLTESKMHPSALDVVTFALSV